jgi:SAM-dependent methyltransferase
MSIADRSSPDRSFPDHFSDAADRYASARPSYPGELFEFIASLAPARARAWDCATGNGQAAVSLARHFRSVLATDASAAQIEQALPCPGVTYSVQPAEATNLESSSFDAVCVAQALHWFHLPAFFAEAGRVMKPGAVFAAWGYGWFEVEGGFDEAFKRLVLDVIAPCWPPQNALLWNGYRDLDFPFEPIAAPDFAIRLSWDFHQLMAYVRTWSATRRYQEQSGSAFLGHAEAELERHWGARESARPVSMPLTLRVGRQPPHDQHVSSAAESQSRS